MTSRSGREQQQQDWRLQRLHHVSIWYVFPAVLSITHQAPPLESRQREERGGEVGGGCKKEFWREEVRTNLVRKNKRLGGRGWKFDCFCNWAMRWQRAWSRWSSIHSGFKRMTVQETGEEKERGTALRLAEKRASARRRKAAQLPDVCVVASVETHVAVRLWWLAVLLLLLVLTLSYCMCFSVCVRSRNQQCVFSCWSVTAQCRRKTPKAHSWTASRIWEALFHHKLDLSSLDLIEAVCGIRPAQWLIDWDRGHSVWRQTCWKSIRHFATLRLAG